MWQKHQMEIPEGKYLCGSMPQGHTVGLLHLAFILYVRVVPCPGSGALMPPVY